MTCTPTLDPWLYEPFMRPSDQGGRPCQYEHCAGAMMIHLPDGAGSRLIFPMYAEECGSVHIYPRKDVCRQNPA